MFGLLALIILNKYRTGGKKMEQNHVSIKSYKCVLLKLSEFSAALNGTML